MRDEKKTSAEISGEAEDMDPSGSKACGQENPKRSTIHGLTLLGEADNHRATLHRSELAHVEDSSVAALPGLLPGYEPQYQVVLPYFGLFAYGVGSRRWLIDPNRILFVSPGWEFTDEHPVAGLGHSAIVINPSRELLDEICGRAGPSKSPAFKITSRPSNQNLLFMTQQMLRGDHTVHGPLQRDEWVVRALQEAINGLESRPARRSHVVDRAKEVLHARGCERISLTDVAKDVGVTPAYLTQEFTRSEGVPLYRYQCRLRLSRSLLELPHCDDITGLALDLGFSSHSHFTTTFREAFEMTPSDYRAGCWSSKGRRQPPMILRAGQPLNRRAA